MQTDSSKPCAAAAVHGGQKLPPKATSWARRKERGRPPGGLGGEGGLEASLLAPTRQKYSVSKQDTKKKKKVRRQFHFWNPEPRATDCVSSTKLLAGWNNNLRILLVGRSGVLVWNLDPVLRDNALPPPREELPSTSRFLFGLLSPPLWGQCEDDPFHGRNASRYVLRQKGIIDSVFWWFFFLAGRWAFFLWLDLYFCQGCTTQHIIHGECRVDLPCVVCVCERKQRAHPKLSSHMAVWAPRGRGRKRSIPRVSARSKPPKVEM